MNRPRNVHVAVVQTSEGIHVWGVSFTLPGWAPPRKTPDGRTDEARAKKIAEAIAGMIATIDFEEALAMSLGEEK